jgi:hypothetical protein
MESMEEIWTTFLTTALEKAFDGGSRYLLEAEQERAKTHKDNIITCIQYVEAARFAIYGLEEEVDEMLIETEQVIRTHWEERSTLCQRISAYLNRDRLRPILDGAIKGISACYDLATPNMQSFFSRPGVVMKAQALKDLYNLLGQLSEYVRYLSPPDPQERNRGIDKVNYAGPSGINLSELLELEELLDDNNHIIRAMDEATRKEKIKTLVDTIQEKRTRQGLPLVAHAKSVIQQLTVAFRLASLTAQGQKGP